MPEPIGLPNIIVFAMSAPKLTAQLILHAKYQSFIMFYNKLLFANSACFLPYCCVYSTVVCFLHVR